MVPQRWLPIGAESVHTFGLTLRNAAFFALTGMVPLSVLRAVRSIVGISGVARGLAPAMAAPASLVHRVAGFGLLPFFAGFHRTQ
jgi:hypothetical protein